jgi:hypothetical protein
MSKKSILVSLAIGLLLISIPVVTLAAEYRAAGSIVVGQEEVVNDDIYIAGGEATVNGTVNGDLFIWAGIVEINGQVNGDVIAAGGEITVNGEINDDLRLAGGIVTISNKVKGDLMIGAGTVTIGNEALVSGETYVGSGTLRIDGEVQAIKAGVGRLEIGSSAKVNDGITYYSEEEGSISDEATILGNTNFNRVENRTDYGVSATAKATSLLGALIIALIAVYYLPNFSSSVGKDWRERPWHNLLWGFLTLIVLPIAAIFLMATVIGLPLGFGIAIIYPIFIYLAMIVASVGLGLCIENYFGKKKKDNPDWVSVVIGLLVYYLVGLIPLLGGLINFVFMLIGLGALVYWKKELFVKLSKDKVI